MNRTSKFLSSIDFVFRSTIGVLLLVSSISTATAQQQCKNTGLSPSIKSTTPTSNFTDNGDGTVTDNLTGLMWAKCAEGLSGENCELGVASTVFWEPALALVNSANTSNFAGYSDWRLANIKELSSIIERACFGPAINLAVFPNPPTADWFWTSTPDPTFEVASLLIRADDGFIGNGNRTIFEAHVRMVRSPL